MYKKNVVLSFFFALIFMLAGAGSAWADEQYIVQAGDNLWSIANQHDVTVDELKAWNYLTGEALQVGQVLVIKVSAVLGEDVEIMYYTVHSDDTLESISALYDTTPATIISDNELFSENIEVGQILKLRVPAGTVERAAAAVGASTYYVQQGDTLSQIAENHAMDITELKNLNGLSSDIIFEGQPLKVTGTFSNVSRGGVTRELPNANTDAATQLIDYAQQFLGTPYAYGGSSPSGFDCSGFVQYVYQNSLGISLQRTAASQAGQGTEVSKSELMPGDIVYFASGGYVDHVGIYIGSGQFIHSSSPSSGGVIISSLSQSYYSSHYAGARRIL